MDSSHNKMQRAGVRSAPVCVDCHGSHEIHDPNVPRVGISNRCGKCHFQINQAYRGSVHGRALIDENNKDVPVCTDCHGAHAISGPHSDQDFHAASYFICAKCHTDSRRMQKYGLKTEVLSTYLDDYHGSTNRMYAQGGLKTARQVANCSSCHGVHAIESLRLLRDRSLPELKKRVLKTCVSCHGEVPPNFADAWLSHEVPSFRVAPLVWMVKLVYSVVIPVSIFALVLHVLLDLWRFSSGRRKEGIDV